MQDELEAYTKTVLSNLDEIRESLPHLADTLAGSDLLQATMKELSTALECIHALGDT